MLAKLRGFQHHSWESVYDSIENQLKFELSRKTPDLSLAEIHMERLRALLWAKKLELSISEEKLKAEYDKRRPKQ